MAIVTETGKLIVKGEVVTGTSKTTGNPWANQQIVIEVALTSTFIKNVAVRTNKTDLLHTIEELPLKAEVEFQYSVSSREWSGKWYTDVDLVSIKPLFTGQKPQTTSPAPVAQPRPQTPQTEPQTKTGKPDDLPW